jgi:uncharacterized protein YecE (DUF72 family)
MPVALREKWVLGPYVPSATLLPMAKRPNRSISQGSLFEPDAPSDAARPTQETDCRFSDSNLSLGTSAFHATGWVGSFYPKGLKPADYLSYYSTKFDALEVDSTFYRTPSVSTVQNWYAKTPKHFVFAVKVPQVITHEKVLVDCEHDLGDFLRTMWCNLREKLGPMLFQFGFFNRHQFKTQDDFLALLIPFLSNLPKEYRFAVEIRNKTWLNQELLDRLRELNVALALTDTSFMPRPWELQKPLDLVTADFAYVRWLGNRKEIETHTTTWDKTIIDRKDELNQWAEIIRNLVLEKKLRKIFAFANNHYAGHAPTTVKLFWDLWEKRNEHLGGHSLI